MEADRKNTERQARPGVEEQRKEAEREAEKTLDKDAISAIEETEKAVNAISSNKSDEAVSALERALGKVDVLLARNAKTARIPVNLEANVIDTAPPDHATIMERALDVAAAVDNQDFPAARVLLHGLISEIRIRTYHLPLSTFPIALKEATRLLEEKKNKEANAVLLTALNTLVAVDRVMPIPVLLAREALHKAQAEQARDKNAAQKSLEAARNELRRAKDLGYAGKDPEYAALNNEISKLEKQLTDNEDLTAAFSKLKDRLAAFLKRQSEHQRS